MAVIQGDKSGNFQVNTTAFRDGEYSVIANMTNNRGKASRMKTHHYFKIIQTGGQTSIKNVAIFPNPYTISSGLPFYFLNVPLDALYIKIYTISGFLLRTINIKGNIQTSEIGNTYGERLEWDVLTDEGKPLSGGLYIYEVKMKENVKVGKFSIVR